MDAHALEEGLRRYLSDDARRRLASARVGVAGAGGLGSNAAAMLARSGVGALTLVDFDRVEPSNLNRQLFWPEDVGRLKVEALADRLRALNPSLRVDVFARRIDASNARALFGVADASPSDAPDAEGGGTPRCDVVVEALDEASAKGMLLRALAGRVGLLVCASGVAGWNGPPMAARRLGGGVVCVGDFVTTADAGCPPMAPRVTMAAAWQADVALTWLLGETVRVATDSP